VVAAGLAVSYRMRWSLWMTASGVATALVVYLLTGSIGWAFVGLLGSGFVLNAIAEAVANGRTGKGARRHASRGKRPSR
jgi:hypothetical protein